MHKLVSAAGCLLVAGLAFAYQSDNEVIKATGFKYQLDKERTIEALGACSFSVEEIKCWDTEGRPATGWPDRLTSYFQSNSGSDFAIRFKKKNRLVVFRTTGPNSSSYNIQTTRQDYSGGGQTSDNSGDTLFWSRVAVEASQTDASFYVNPYTRTEFKSIDIPFREGEKGTLQGSTFEMGAWKALPKPKGPTNMNGGYGGSGVFPQNFTPYGVNPAALQWSFVMGLDGSLSNFSFQAVDKDGKIIRYVDLKGKPISAVKYLEGANPQQMNNGFPPQNSKYQNAMIQTGGQNVPGAISLITNVDPKAIAAIKVGYSRQMSILFEGIPLDPKG